MKQRLFGNTGRMVSEIGLGTWQLGTVWGDPFNHEEAMRILESAYESGITMIDTADVYNGGNSEKAVGEILKKYPDHFYVTTKCGRRSNPHTPESYTAENVSRYVDDSLSRFDAEKIDMVLLHCPPTPVYQKDEVFTALDKLKQTGKIGSYGVSIEKVSEGIAAMEYGISAMEVIFNMFRLKPLEELFPAAQKNQVGIIARVPLASGLLTGRYNENTTFGEKDHRTYNREGAAFDKGETFSGVDFQLGLKAASRLKELFGTENLIPYALRWILMHDAVSVVIPGASKVAQVASNVQAAELPPLTSEQMDGVKKIYDELLRESIHPNW